MKTALYSALLFAMFLPLSSLGFSEEAREKDHEALRAILKTIVHAINTQKLEEMESVFADSFTVTMVDQTRIRDLKGFHEYFRKLFDEKTGLLKSMTIEPEADRLTEFLSEDVGVDEGISKDTYVLRNGRTVQLNSKWSGTFKKFGDQWKVVSMHVGLNFLDNPVLAAREKEKFLWAGLALALGILLGLLFSRRK